MADLISWDTALHVASRVARRQEPISDRQLRSLEADFGEMTTEAEELVAAETGLRSLSGPARARVVDREQWVNVNVKSFQRLLRPVTDKLAARMTAPRGGAAGPWPGRRAR